MACLRDKVWASPWSDVDIIEERQPNNHAQWSYSSRLGSIESNLSWTQSIVCLFVYLLFLKQGFSV